MTLSFRDGVTVFQLVVYIPLFAIAGFLWKRDGLGPGSGSWRFSMSFCSLRISGAICSLIAISKHSEVLEISILISEVIGIQALILSLIILTTRINHKINLVPKSVYISVSIISLAGVALGIYGAVKLIEGKSSVIKPNAYLQAALATFLALYTCLIGLVVVFGSRWKSYCDPLDKRVILALVPATFFLGIKHLDAALWEYGNVAAFGISGGSTAAWFLMSVLMEIFTVGINLGFGISYGRPQKAMDDADSETDTAENSLTQQGPVDSATDLTVKDEQIGIPLEKV